ncbi:MAG TPA: N-terminal phage integrase SAM-like domain-containing protein [Acidimicrobiales bacterium]|nr:N-terminal phage integrase SAM-like domain-containing protein [Acidimicrobiales bacterium]
MILTRSTKTGRRYDVRLRDPAGRVYTRTFATKKEAEVYAAAEKTDRVRGAWVDPRRGAVTLRQWSERWMAERPQLRMRTQELYRGLLVNHILPAFGDTELGKITPSDVRSWYARLRGSDGPEACTTAKAYRLLRAIMRAGVADELIARSPCVIVGGGTEHSPERPVLTVGEVGALADAIVPRFRALVILSAWCGLRRGELLGPPAFRL